MCLSRIIAVSGVLALTLTGCGVFGDHTRDYQRAASISPLVIPPGMKSQPLEPLYTIPRIAEQEVTALDLGSGEAPRPDPLSRNTEETKVKIQKVGAHRWILVDASSSQIWPLTQSFLASQNIVLAKTQPAQGIIETGWQGYKTDTASKNRYRIAIEQGVHPDTTEVHVIHQQLSGSEANTALWPEESSSAEREAAMLDQLATNLADGVSNRAASLLGQTVGGDVKSSLTIVKGEPVLRLNLSSERASATLARAVTSEGFVSWGQIPDAGVFYVGYKDQANPPGWFKRVFLRAKTAASATARQPLEQVIQHLAPQADVQQEFNGVPGVAYGEPLKKAEGYLIHVSADGKDGKGQIVRLRNHRGEQLPAVEAKKLLNVLRRNLI